MILAGPPRSREAALCAFNGDREFLNADGNPMHSKIEHTDIVTRLRCFGLTDTRIEHPPRGTGADFKNALKEVIPYRNQRVVSVLFLFTREC